MAAPASELGWVVHFAPVVRFTPLSPTLYHPLPIVPQCGPVVHFPIFVFGKGRRPLGEAWLRVGAIITAFNISLYGVAR